MPGRPRRCLREPGTNAPTFSANNSTTATNSTVQFYLAGTYVFTATITDQFGNAVAGTVTVVVNQTPTTVVIAPSPVNITVGTQQQFTATADDQFGNVISYAAFTWAVTGGSGSVNTSSGLYTAPASAGSATLSATSTPGSVVGTASIYVVLVPAAPASLTATAVSYNQVNLSWSAVSGATGYNVYRGTVSGGESATPLNSSPLTGTTCQDTPSAWRRATTTRCGR